MGSVALLLVSILLADCGGRSGYLKSVARLASLRPGSCEVAAAAELGMGHDIAVVSASCR